MHPCLHPSRMPLRVSDELDRVPELSRVSKIHRLDPVDAFAIDVARPDADLVGDRPQDRQLVSGVEASHIIGRIGLRVSGRLRLADGILERQLLGGHAAEHVVGGSVYHR